MDEMERNKILFSSLVMTFHAAAMQHMGKIKNPLNDKIEQNLEQAQYVIDMLDMLSTHTKGNLSEEEQRLLTTVSQELKLNYVDEISKQQTPPKEKQ
jgi:hypothetical protein